MKKSFVLYNDQYEAVEDLTDEQKGQLLDAMFLYSRGEELKEYDPIVKMAFKFFRIVFDRDNLKWEAVANRNKNNGKKGGRPKGNKNSILENNPEEPKKPSGLSGNTINPEEPKKPVSGSVNVNVNGNGSVKLMEDKTLTEFNNFWDLYQKKKDHKKCLAKWKLLTKKEKDSIFNCVSSYVQSTSDPQFRKNPLTWLNGKCWNDEIVYQLNPAEKRLKQNIEISKEWLNESR